MMENLPGGRIHPACWTSILIETEIILSVYNVVTGCFCLLLVLLPAHGNIKLPLLENQPNVQANWTEIPETLLSLFCFH